MMIVIITRNTVMIDTEKWLTIWSGALASFDETHKRLYNIQYYEKCWLDAEKAIMLLQTCALLECFKVEYIVYVNFRLGSNGSHRFGRVVSLSTRRKLGETNTTIVKIVCGLVNSNAFYKQKQTNNKNRLTPSTN